VVLLVFGRHYRPYCVFGHSCLVLALVVNINKKLLDGLLVNQVQKLLNNAALVQSDHDMLRVAFQLQVVLKYLKQSEVLVRLA
jgi:hypothetical protein